MDMQKAIARADVLIMSGYKYGGRGFALCDV